MIVMLHGLTTVKSDARPKVFRRAFIRHVSDTAMRLEFDLSAERLIVTLVEGGKEIARTELTDMRGLSQGLLPALDDLLVLQGIPVMELEGIDVRPGVPSAYTSARIVDATVRMLRSVRSSGPG